ncbi:MAG: hypothetical protein ACK5NT_02430 [Pyrinomonadaceae bacterium]
MINFNKLLFFSAFILFLFSVNALATAQIGDKLIFDGKEYRIQTTPLETYFGENPNLRPETAVHSTNLWRGYIATFEIANKSLKLADIQIQTVNDKNDVELKSVFDKYINAGGTSDISWFTGYLIAPYGKMVDYEPMGFGSTFEHYLLISVENGEQKRTFNFSGRQFSEFRAKQFENYKKTPEYRAKVTFLLKDRGFTANEADEFLRDFVVDYISAVPAK